MEKEEYAVLTEVGVFGGLGIEDPTKKKIQVNELDALIEQANVENLKNLK